jgi:DNA-binding NarL/FixJ family response regulator
MWPRSLSERQAVTVVVGSLDPLLHLGLAHVLAAAPGVELIASDLTDVALEDVVARQAPRVVILGETSEYALLARLKSRRHAPGVLVLAQEQPLLWGALLAEGTICLPRDAKVEEILAVVRRVAAGGGVSVGVHRRDLDRRQSRNPPALTRRQAQVFGFLSDDKPYAAIALEMKIGVATVRTHARAVFRKLGVQNRHELVGRSLPGGSLSGSV